MAGALAHNTRKGKRDLGGRRPLYSAPMVQTSVMLRQDQLRWMSRQGRQKKGVLIREALVLLIEKRKEASHRRKAERAASEVVVATTSLGADGQAE